MTTDKKSHPARAEQPEDITRLFVQFVNEGDAEALAGLYEPDAVVGYPPGKQTVGRAAIRHSTSRCSPANHNSNKKSRCRPSAWATLR